MLTLLNGNVNLIYVDFTERDTYWTVINLIYVDFTVNLIYVDFTER